MSPQSILFLADHTLRGRKRDVYVLAKVRVGQTCFGWNMKYRIVSSHILSKVLKFCTGSSAKSYQCKFAVNDVLVNREPASDELGAALREVIHHSTIRDKFTSVHPDLRARGITRVEVRDDGLFFARDTGE